MVIRLREKGQITIPLRIREALHLSKDSILYIGKVGNGILLTPKPSAVEAMSAGFIKEAKAKGITLNDLLEDLRKIRHSKK